MIPQPCSCFYGHLAKSELTREPDWNQSGKMISLTEIKVRGYHTDIYGHVNNARYLEFFEEERWAQFDANVDLRKWADKGLVSMVVNINVNYRKAVSFGERLLVSTGVEKIGNRSAVLKQEIRIKDSGELAADALVTFVLSDKTGQLLSMDDDMAEGLLEIGRSRPQ